MAASIEKRAIRREITQFLVLPLDLDTPIEEQCARRLISRLRGTPSEWGVMVDDHLLDLRVGKYTTPISYGTQVMVSVPVKATYEVVGYIVGDVLFEASLADRLADEPIISQFRRVDILGLPFQINVRTKSNVPSMNIQIIDSRIEGTLQYIAAPAFYPFYSPLMAHLASSMPQRTSLYADTPVPKLKSKPSKAEWRLIDPLYGMSADMRRRRIVGEIRRMLGILPSDQAGVSVANAAQLFEGKPKVIGTVASRERPIIIEFMEVEEALKKVDIYERAGTAHYTFIRVPSMLPFSPIIAAVSWLNRPERISTPSREQVEQFEREVNSLIKLRRLEMDANSRVYGSEALADPNAGQSPEAILLREHLEAGLKIARGLAAEAVGKAPERPHKLISAIDGKPPISISPQVPMVGKRGRGRGKAAVTSAAGGSGKKASRLYR